MFAAIINDGLAKIVSLSKNCIEGVVQKFWYGSSMLRVSLNFSKIRANRNTLIAEIIRNILATSCQT